MQFFNIKLFSPIKTYVALRLNYNTSFPHSISQIIKVILEVKHSGKSQQKNSFKSLYFKHNPVKPTVIVLRTLKLFGGKIDLTLKRFVLNQYTARNNFV